MGVAAAAVAAAAGVVEGGRTAGELRIPLGMRRLFFRSTRCDGWLTMKKKAEIFDADWYKSLFLYSESISKMSCFMVLSHLPTTYFCITSST